MPNDVAGPTLARATGSLAPAWGRRHSGSLGSPGLGADSRASVGRGTCAQEGAACSSRACTASHFPHQRAPPPASPLGLPNPSPTSLGPQGSNRSSRGQNTISFNKLNLLRLLITSGVASDQKERGRQPWGSLWWWWKGNEEHAEGGRGITTWPRGAPGDPSPSHRRSGQVSILLDKNRKEGAHPPLPLAQERNSPLPKKGQRVYNTEITGGVRAESSKPPPSKCYYKKPQLHVLRRGTTRGSCPRWGALPSSSRKLEEE